MKIWHQSMTDLSKLEHYRKNLVEHAAGVLNSEITVVPHGVPAGLYSYRAPVEALKYPYTEFLCERMVCEAVVAAEQDGFNAFTIGCYLDKGLQLARSLVDIPVLGITETSMLVACSLGKKFGIVTISSSMREHLSSSADEYELTGRVSSILSVDPPINEYDMEGDPERENLAERVFKEACDKAIDDGADVIIPGEGVLNEFLFKKKITNHNGVPILDGNAALWQFAVLLANLQRASNLTVGRRSAYARPPKGLLDDLQRIYQLYNLSSSDFS